MPDHFIKTTSDPFSSSSSSGASMGAPKTTSSPSATTGAPSASGAFTEGNLMEKKLVCPFCYTKQLLREKSPCPNEHCYSFIKKIGMPKEVFTHKLFPIAIVGASSSGKSHFLAALRHCLTKGDGARWGEGIKNGYWEWAFVEYSNSANDDASVDNPYIGYEKRLFIDHRTLASTRRDDEHPPLLLSLKYLHPCKRLFDDPWFVKRSLLVAITDTAGEHVQEELIGKMDDNYPVLKRIKGIIIMLERDKAEEANSLLADFKRDTRKMEIPTALCLSKIDELPHHNEEFPTAWLNDRFNTNISIPGRLVLPDIENNSNEVSKWMEARGDLQETANNFKHSFKYHAFFAVSALGRDPFSTDSDGRPVVDPSNGALVLKGTPKPLRVMDPLLWILWQYGQLGGIEKNAGFRKGGSL
ncbi:MAG: hypothetical protein IJS08_02630 [Victivallales bacterium]|nr:hypothetical protein [Victivallales bacterium]